MPSSSRPPKKRRHHHVWQYHLKAWASDSGQVWVRHRGGAPYPNSPINVAVERDFYRHRPLSPDESAFARRLVETMNPPFKKHALEWIDLLSVGHGAAQAFERGDLDEEDHADVDVGLNNVVENLHEQVEQGVLPVLDRLRQGDLSVADDPEAWTQLCIYLGTQYMRTTSKQAALTDSFSDLDPARFDPQAMVGALRIVLGFTFAQNLAFRREATDVRLVHAEGESTFITGDQPVVNTQAVHAPAGVEPEALTLFFPVGPSLGLQLECDSGEGIRESASLGSLGVQTLNGMMAAEAERQLVGASKANLAAVPFD